MIIIRLFLEIKFDRMTSWQICLIYVNDTICRVVQYLLLASIIRFRIITNCQSLL